MGLKRVTPLCMIFQCLSAGVLIPKEIIISVYSLVNFSKYVSLSGLPDDVSAKFLSPGRLIK